MGISRVLISILVMTIPFFCYGIDIGPLTNDLDYEQGFLTKKVRNDSEYRNIYQINVYEIDHPGKNEKIINVNNRDLLFNPKQFILNGNSFKLVKFYFSGDGDRERYYRVILTEIPAPTSSAASIKMHMVIKLSSILVVSPKNKQLDYQLDLENKSIINTGNSYFEVMVKENCDSSDMESESKYIIPGGKYTSDSISKETPIIIIYDKRFHYINGNCNIDG